YTLNNQTQTVTIGATNVSKPQNVTVVDGQINGSIKIVKTNENGSEKLQGAEFKVTGPNGFDQTVTTDNNGAAELNNLAWGTYTIKETKAPVGYALNNQPQTVEVTKDSVGQVQVSTFKDTQILGKLQIVKTNEKGEKLQGAEFTVTGPNGFSQNVTTDANGVANLSNLAWGTYNIKEIKAPQGYDVQNNIQPVVINANNVQTVQVSNVVDGAMSGKILITKLGKDGAKLQGAEFTVKDANGKIVATATTNANGVAEVTGLPWGTYTIQETKAPQGYTLSGKTITVQVNAQNVDKTQNITVNDTQVLGAIQITKFGKDNTKLQGAEFTVTGPNGFNKVVTTNASGVANLNDLAWGTYTVKETKAPVGYTLNKETQTVTINAENVSTGTTGAIAPNVQKISVQDNQIGGQLQIVKTNANGSEKLQGAEFTVTGPNGFNQAVTTNKDGVANLNNLAWGTYTIKETKAPIGYTLNSTPQTVQVTKDTVGQVQVSTFKDTQILGQLQIVKTNEKGNKLAGAEFTVTGPNGFNKVVTTDNNGVASLANLAWGTYNIKETKAPQGYDIQNNIKPVVINAENAQTVQVSNVVDGAMSGKVLITKLGKDGAKLQGAQFTVKNSDGKVVATVTTNNDGVAEVTGLPWGTYTIQETVAPKGYALNDKITTIEVNAQNVAKTQNVTVNDTQVLGTIQITKLGKDGVKLQGAQFTVTGPNGYKEVVTTDNNGVADLNNLAWGTYTIKETKAPVGYSLNNQTQTVTINANNVSTGITGKIASKVQNVTVNDSQILGQLQVTKTNEDGNKTLQGAQFTVTGPNGFNQTITTGENGVASLNNLPWGTYTVKETKAPVGYNLNETPQTVEVTKASVGKAQGLVFKDTKTTGTVEISKVDVTNEKEVAGAKINISGTSLTGEKVNINFTSGTTPTKFTLPAGTYTYTEVDAPVGYQINKTVGHFTISTQGQIVKAVIKDQRIQGGLEVIKTNEAGNKKLEGAQFTVTGPNKFNEVITTNQDGIATLNNLAWGTYTIKETKAPIGYNLNETPQTVQVTKESVGKVQVSTFKDTKTTGTLEISKVDVTNEKEVAGAKINISGTSLTGEKVNINFTSGTTPTKFTLPAGTYTYTEVDAPVGYQINKTVGHFTISTQGQIVKATVKDQRIDGGIQIVKTNEAGNKKLEGAQFTVTGPNGFDKTVTTDNNGVANLNDLAWGTYTIKETKAPSGYNLNQTPQTVQVTKDSVGKVQVSTFKDTKTTGTVEISKVDATNEKEVAGAKINISGTSLAGDKVNISFTSGLTPTKFTLPAGTYTYTEVDAPVGYNINKTVGHFTISKQGQIVKAVVKDTPTMGTVEVSKVDVTNGKEVAGAKINISGTSLRGKKIDINFTSGTTPTKFTLPAGNYTYKEIDAPVGYEINTTVGHFSISKQGQIVKAVVKDQRIDGKIEIVKTNEAGNQRLEGAQFTVTGPNNFNKVVTTNKNGVANLDNLAWGTYTIKETKAPVGYNLNETPQTIQVTNKSVGQVQVGTFKDVKTTGAVEISKVDVTNEKEVAGAKINISGTSLTGEKVNINFTSGTTPTKFTLPAGTYTYTEVDAPVGYQINKTVGHFTISTQGQIVKAVVKDQRIPGKIEIVKTNEAGNKKLEGAQFTVTGPNNFNKTITTNKNGVANLNDLAWGTYTVKETKAPIGYNLNETPQTIQVTNKSVGQVQVATFKDVKTTGTLEISKVDATNEKEVAGAKINISGTSLTGEKININFTSGTTATKFTLPAGSYTYTEVDAPVGYNINKTVGHFTISKQGQIVKAVVKDTPITGIVKISKVDVTNEKEVAGAKIDISGTSLTGKKVNISFTSGTTPTTFTLPAGTYTYTEVDAPVGYLINKTVGTFTISKQGQIVKAVVKDQRIAGNIQITKTNSNGTEKLSGATFQVLGPNGFSKTVTTGANGEADLSGLPWGHYLIKETKAPTGYAVNPEIFNVNISANNASVSQNVTVKDNLIPVHKNINNNNTNNSNNSNNNTSPKTGDSSQMPIVVLGAAALIILLVINRKKILRSKS
ncbi:MAG: SpaA isopeptide-forming pilin-related protein, partial [Clostridium sp.]